MSTLTIGYWFCYCTLQWFRLFRGPQYMQCRHFDARCSPFSPQHYYTSSWNYWDKIVPQAPHCKWAVASRAWGGGGSTSCDLCLIYNDRIAVRWTYTYIIPLWLLIVILRYFCRRAALPCCCCFWGDLFRLNPWQEETSSKRLLSYSSVWFSKELI